MILAAVQNAPAALSAAVTLAGVLAAGAVSLASARRRAQNPSSGERDLIEALSRTHDGVALSDSRGRFVWVNAQWASLVDARRADDLIGTEWWSICPANDARRIRNEILPHAARQGAWTGTLAGFTGGRRQSRACEMSITPVRGGQVLWVAREISGGGRPRETADLLEERSDAPAVDPISLGRDNDDLLTAVDAADIAVMICRPAERGMIIHRVNDAFTRMTGYEPAEVIGRDPVFLQGPETDPDAIEELASAIDVRRRSRVTILNYRKDSSTFWNDLIMVPLRRGDGSLRCWVGVSINVSMAVMLEHERSNWVERFQHAQKLEAVGRLAGGVAHDLNNVLAIVMGFAETLQVQLTGKQRACVDGIVSGVERGGLTINRLLAFSRPEEGGSRELVDAVQLVDGVVRLLRGAMTHEFYFTADFPRNELPVRVEVAAVEQAVVNLFVNARDALESSSGRIQLNVDWIPVIGGRAEGIQAAGDPERTDACAAELVQGDACHCRVWAGLLKPGAYLRIRVEDNGVGMSVDVARRLFEPFFTTKPSDTGTGLGMSSVLSVVRAHNGGVHVESRVGEGTRVSLLLPLEAEAETAVAPTVASAERGGHSGGHVILVDDEPAILASLGGALEQAGYTTHRCETGGEALKLINSENYAVSALVSDYHLPIATGLDLAEAAKMRDQNIRTILYTGAVDQTEAVNEKYVFCDALIRKPVASSRILAEIAK